MSLPHRECTASRPRRRSAVVDDVVVDERRGVDELDDGGVEDRAVAGVTAQAAPPSSSTAGRMRLPPAGAGCALTDLRDQRDPRLHVPREFLRRPSRGPREIGSKICEGQRLFHSGSGGLYHGLNKLWKFNVVRFASSGGAGTVHLGERPRHPPGDRPARSSLPRRGAGRRKGLSVSTSSRSSGRDARGLAETLSETIRMPANETCRPSSRPAAASAVLPVNGAARPRAPPPSSSRISSVSSSASRVWMTIGLPQLPERAGLAFGRPAAGRPSASSRNGGQPDLANWRGPPAWRPNCSRTTAAARAGSSAN